VSEQQTPPTQQQIDTAKWIHERLTDYFMASIATSQLRTYEPPYVSVGPKTALYQRLNLIFHIAAVVMGLASLAAFICGVLDVRFVLANIM
jgi:hypothetical protein